MQPSYSVSLINSYEQQQRKISSPCNSTKTNAVELNRDRIKNREMIRESQRIAMMVLSRLDEWGWSQLRLAEEMQVSPQQVIKIVRGKERLDVETRIKLQSILKVDSML